MEHRARQPPSPVAPEGVGDGPRELPAAGPRAPGGCPTRAVHMPASRSPGPLVGARRAGRACCPGLARCPEDGLDSGGAMTPRRLRRTAAGEVGVESVRLLRRSAATLGSHDRVLSVVPGFAGDGPLASSGLRPRGGPGVRTTGCPVVGPRAAPRRSPAALSRTCVAAAPRAPRSGRTRGWAGGPAKIPRRWSGRAAQRSIVARRGLAFSVVVFSQGSGAPGPSAPWPPPREG